jgi:phosphatidylserine/phosphatidylglycerophosphate/cardiolipin synthase-like enzyme
MAIYDFGLDSVADALLRAQMRGVRIRVVTDTDNLKNPPSQRLVNAGVPVVDDKRGALMHHKFAVFDGATLLTGAWNFAERDTLRHNNNTAVFRSPDLARNFTNEFEKMFTARRLGPTKPRDVPNPVVQVGNTRVETWFASEQDLPPVILQRVRAARSNVAFMAFSFTLDDIGTALQQLVQNGVGVWGVIETTGSDTKQSEYGRLKDLKAQEPHPPFPGCQDGPAVLTDGNPYLMHHKVFVIDQRTVILGSFNFTNNAANDNDEAMLIVDDPTFARQFLAEFCRVYNVAVNKAAAKK